MSITNELIAALEAIGKDNSHLLYIKEDPAGNIVGIVAKKKGNFFTQIFTEWGMNLSKFKRYRGNQTELAVRVHNFVLQKMNAYELHGIEKSKVVDNLDKLIERLLKNATYETKQLFQKVQDLKNIALYKPNPIVLPGNPSSAKPSVSEKSAEEALSSIPKHVRDLLIRQKPNGPVAKLERYFIQNYAERMLREGISREAIANISNAITAEMGEYEIDTMVDAAVKKHTDHAGLSYFLKVWERNRLHFKETYVPLLREKGFSEAEINEIHDSIKTDTSDFEIKKRVQSAISSREKAAKEAETRRLNRQRRPVLIIHSDSQGQPRSPFPCAHLFG